MPNNPLRVITWKEIKHEVAQVNRPLYHALSQIEEVDSQKCVIAEYPFGHHSIIDGAAQLPLAHEDRVVELHNLQIPQPIRQLLDYNWDYYPLGMILSNRIEINFNLTTHSAPVKILTPGTLLAIHNILKTNTMSYTQHGASFVAGTQSLFLLSRISEKSSYQKLLNTFELTDQPLVKSLSEQSHLINQLARSKHFQHHWHTKVLLFGGPLFQKIEQNQNARSAFLNQALQQTNTSGDAMFIDVIWSLFSHDFQPKTKASLAVTETTKHLVKLMMGRLPGFAPAIDDSAAPMTQFTNIFKDIYKPRFYYPVFMQSSYYDGAHPLYYSLQKPAFLRPYNNDKNGHRTIAMLKEIAETLQAFKDYLGSRRCPIQIDNAPLTKLLCKVEVAYFHPQGEGLIQSDIEQLVSEDVRFIHLAEKAKGNRKLSFPLGSPFFNGCIRIRPENAGEEKPKMKEFLIPLRGTKSD